MELEIESVVCFFNIKNILVSVVPYYYLLKEHQSSLVAHFLPNLNLSTPSVGSVCFLAVLALLVLDLELCNEVLLQHSVVKDLFLDGDLHFDPERVWFSPQKLSINHFESFHSSYILETK